MNPVLLRLENITKKYGDNLVLDSVSLEVAKGEVCAILGPSGCGKSTFLRCINGLESIQGGKIFSKTRKLVGRAQKRNGKKCVKKSVWYFKIMIFFLI